MHVKSPDENNVIVFDYCISLYVCLSVCLSIYMYLYIFLYQIKSCFSPTMHNKSFTQAEIRAISELRVRLVEAVQNMYFFC